VTMFKQPSGFGDAFCGRGDEAASAASSRPVAKRNVARASGVRYGVQAPFARYALELMRAAVLEHEA
jgi:hypothetical protein